LALNFSVCPSTCCSLHRHRVLPFLSLGQEKDPNLPQRCIDNSFGIPRPCAKPLIISHGSDTFNIHQRQGDVGSDAVRPRGEAFRRSRFCPPGVVYALLATRLRCCKHEFLYLLHALQYLMASIPSYNKNRVTSLLDSRDKPTGAHSSRAIL
jgi:hypothetical protein